MSSIHCLLGLPWWRKPSTLPSKTVSAKFPALPLVTCPKYCSFIRATFPITSLSRPISSSSIRCESCKFPLICYYGIAECTWSIWNKSCYVFTDCTAILCSTTHAVWTSEYCTCTRFVKYFVPFSLEQVIVMREKLVGILRHFLQKRLREIDVIETCHNSEKVVISFYSLYSACYC